MTIYKFPLKNYIFNIISFESVLVKNRITEFELMCALQEINKGTNYF